MSPRVVQTVFVRPSQVLKDGLSHQLGQTDGLDVLGAVQFVEAVLHYPGSGDGSGLGAHQAGVVEETVVSQDCLEVT